MKSVVSADGTSIGYSMSGDGPPLVLVHGMTADASRWAPIVPALGEHYTVYAMDRRGRGASGDAAAYALDREHEDVAALVNAIGAPTRLVAHSYGGVCALGALLLTTQVERLVVYEPYVPAVPVTEASAITLRYEAMPLETTAERDAIVATFLREIVQMSERDVALLRAQPSWSARVAAAYTIARELRAAEHYRFEASRFADVRIPIGMLLGGDSPPFLKDATARLHAALPTSRVVILAGQGHAAMNTAPHLFVRELRALLEQSWDGGRLKQ